MIETGWLQDVVICLLCEELLGKWGESCFVEARMSSDPVWTMALNLVGFEEVATTVEQAERVLV
jgi:hypothetical protein